MLQWASKTGLGSEDAFSWWEYYFYSSRRVIAAYFVFRSSSCSRSFSCAFLRLTSLGLRIKLSRSCRMKNGVCNLNWVRRSERGMLVDLDEVMDAIDFLVNSFLITLKRLIMGKHFARPLLWGAHS